MLRNRGGCRKVFFAALAAVVPPAVVLELQRVTEGRPLPGQSTLVHCEFVADAAFMLIMRDRMQELLAGEDQPARVAKFDSSPQGGVDWMNSHWDVIAGT